MNSVNKIRRILRLLEILQSGRPHSATALAEFCGTSRRTIFRDLKTLEESGVTVLYDSRAQGHWIPNQVSLPPTELSLAETLALLVLAQDSTAHDRSVPFQLLARDAAIKLRGNLPNHLQGYIEDLVSAIRIETEPLAESRHSHQHYQRLLQGITGHTKVRIRYDSLSEKKIIQTLISPYRLLFRRHAWYLIGRSSAHRAVRTFHVGRILETESTNESFEVPPRFSLRRYFGNAWSLVREKDAEANVVVKFSPLVARNVAEVTWHPTQQTRFLEDGSLEFKVTVDGIQEISWWVQSYGDQALVLNPPSLRDLILHRAQRVCEQYQSTSEPTPRSRRRAASAEPGRN